MKANVTIPFEESELSFSLPKTWRVAATLQPSQVEPLSDLREGLLSSLENPIGAVALKNRYLSSARIILAVDDITRPTPVSRYFEFLIEYLLSCGAKKENMLILFALGVHRKMTDEEAASKIGANNLRGIKWLNHDSRDDKGVVKLGLTARGTFVALNKNLAEADLIICVGAIEPHLLLGFGGGLKMILPGLAHERTVAENHMQGVTPEMYNYIGSLESPMRLDLEEAVSMLGKEIFIVNAIMNERLEICRFVYGDPIKAHREGAKMAEKINAAHPSELADVAIVASSPMNADLRQGMKCIGNIEKSVKDNGLVLAFLECANGMGDISPPPRAMPNFVLRLLLRALGKERVLWFIDRVKKGAGVEERFMAHFSMQIVRKLRIFVYSKKLPKGTDKKLGLFIQFEDFQKMLDKAARIAPKNASVLIYPYGGVTYPVYKE